MVKIQAKIFHLEKEEMKGVEVEEEVDERINYKGNTEDVQLERPVGAGIARHQHVKAALHRVDGRGERRAVDAVSHWWICCCYCAPRGKIAACCVRCMRQLWSLHVDFSLMNLAFGSYSICLPGGVACGRARRSDRPAATAG